MANEIKVTTGLIHANPATTGALGSLNVTNRQQSITQNTAAPIRVGGSFSIGTTEEALPLTDLTTNGWARFRNRNATNFVTVGVKPAATYYPLIRLNGGTQTTQEECLVRLAQGITPYIKADTGACIVDIDILDD